MKRQIIILAVYLGFASVGSACSVPVPDWRTDPPGIPPTTYQMWTFDDDDNPAVPEVVANSYGTPLAALSGSCYSLDWKWAYKGRYGVWYAKTLDVVLEIPNRPVLEGYKEIWAEVIFQGSLDEAGVLTDPQGSIVIPLGQQIISLADNWKRLSIGWRVEPNPYSEVVSLRFTGSGGFVDSVLVDTNCIPEPATILLFGAGGLILLRKRSS
jgi:hypothetical protein